MLIQWCPTLCGPMKPNNMHIFNANRNQWASLVVQMIKNLSAVQETWVQFLGQEDSLEKEMTTYSSMLAWRIPRTEGSGGL